jgi:small-conductance mechanosensitive channel
LDLQLRIGYSEDIDRVHEVLLGVARANPLCLDEPQPQFFFKGFGDSMVEIQFSVWVTRENFIEVRNRMHADVKRALDEAGIEIPFPQRVLHIPRDSSPIIQKGTEKD